MGAHLILMGPSTAGKSELMIGLAAHEAEPYRFTIDRHWTTRARRRSNGDVEGDQENIFVTPAAFEVERRDFLFTFQTYGDYEYGIPPPSRLTSQEVRMRILPPLIAGAFRRYMPEPTVFCAITPFSVDPAGIMQRRDDHADPREIERRLQAYDDELYAARAVADIHFRNRLGLGLAVTALHGLVVEYLQEHNL